MTVHLDNTDVTAIVHVEINCVQILEFKINVSKLSF